MIYMCTHTPPHKTNRRRHCDVRVVQRRARRAAGRCMPPVTFIAGLDRIFRLHDVLMMVGDEETRVAYPCPNMNTRTIQHSWTRKICQGYVIY